MLFNIENAFVHDTNWQVGIEGNFLYLIKYIVSILFNGEKSNAFPLKLGMSQDCLLSPFLFN